MSMPDTLQVNGITVPAGYIVQAVTNRLARKGYRRDANGTVSREGQELTSGELRAVVRREGVAALRGKATRMKYAGKRGYSDRIHAQADAIERDGSRWARLLMPHVRHALPEVADD